jgi:hypothetical protein
MSEVGQKINEKAAKIWRVGTTALLYQSSKKCKQDYLEKKKKKKKRNCVCGVGCVACGVCGGVASV